MPALQVKDFPRELYDNLKACAVASDRSISQQTVHIIRNYLSCMGTPSAMMDACETGGAASADYAAARSTVADLSEREQRIRKRQATFAQLEALPPIDVPAGFPSAAELVRAGRGERMGAIFSSMEEPA